MIQRYSICLNKTKISQRFEAAAPKDFKPVYNASQAQQLPIITTENSSRIEMVQWGMIPYSSKDPLIGDKLINARVQTIKVKSPFCDLISSKRCVVLADGFFLWKESHGVRTPYRVVMRSDQAFGIAGVWDEWRMEDNYSTIFKTFSIITTSANSLVESTTDRMPAILPLGEEKSWIREKMDLDAALEQLVPYDPAKMRMYKVANLVNDETVNSIKVIKEINATMPGETLSLFD